MNISNFFRITVAKIIIEIILLFIIYTLYDGYLAGPNVTGYTTNVLNWLFAPFGMIMNTIFYGPGAGPEFPNFITLIGILLNLIWYYVLACIIVLIVDAIKNIIKK